MVAVSRTFVVGRPAGDVLAYLMDFGNTPEWDPGTEECVRLDDGPVTVGATWRNVSRVGGRRTELTYRLQTMQDGRVVFVGTNDRARATDDITVSRVDAGSEITYVATIELLGAARLLAPVMKILFERLADLTVERLTRVLAS